jgi:hypothetical protein
MPNDDMVPDVPADGVVNNSSTNTNTQQTTQTVPPEIQVNVQQPGGFMPGMGPGNNQYANTDNSYNTNNQYTNSSAGPQYNRTTSNYQSLSPEQIALENRRAKLDEIREQHQFELALRKELFSEEQIEREYQRQVKLDNEHWVKSNWRPVLAWLYLITILADFVIFPGMQMLMWEHMPHGNTDHYTQWTSLTLSYGGIYHAGIAAILGVSVWSRSNERIAANNSPTAYRST